MARKSRAQDTPPSLTTSKKPFPGAAPPFTKKGGGRRSSKSGSK